MREACSVLSVSVRLPEIRAALVHGSMRLVAHATSSRRDNAAEMDCIPDHLLPSSCVRLRSAPHAAAGTRRP